MISWLKDFNKSFPEETTELERLSKIFSEFELLTKTKVSTMNCHQTGEWWWGVRRSDGTVACGELKGDKWDCLSQMESALR